LETSGSKWINIMTCPRKTWKWFNYSDDGYYNYIHGMIMAVL
jgi:hypothetical protein